MKPILIDALYINMGGGLMILSHLINHLVEKGIQFSLIKDERCPSLESENKVPELFVLPPSVKARRDFYKKNKDKFGAVLCFANIPPTVKLDVPVNTYVHNVNLLKIPSDYPLRKKLSAYLKRLFIRRYAKNTSDWIVQTENTASLVRKAIAKEAQKIHIFPFYKLPNSLTNKSLEPREDYVFIGDHSKAKGHEYLVEAWSRLKDKGIDKTLHLTCSDSEEFNSLVENYVANGVNIINHGKIPFDKVQELYHRSKATVYPSLNESLGLGIIEAMETGCDVIGCDLPYLHCVCSPSETFKPADADSIVEAVIRYEKGNSSKTKIKIHDMVNEFIDYICNSIFQ